MNIDKEVYNEIANILMRHVPDQWSSLWVDAEIEDDNSKQTYDYVNEDGEENCFQVPTLNDSLSISRGFRAVRDEMHAQTGDKWKKVRFTVNKDLTFNAEFEYE